MPKGFASPGGAPELRGLAGLLGDTSTIKKFYGPKGEEMAVQRLQNRALGRMGGKATGMVKAHFGLWGMIALAEFLAFFKGWIQFKASREVWVGTLANYASYIDGGWVDTHSGRIMEPSRFFSKAVQDVVEGRSSNKAFSNLFKPPAFIDKRGNVRLRAGLYEGQRFVSDLHGFYTGDIVGRAGRREAGRGIASFFWGTLRNPKRNILEGMAAEVVRNARRNLLNSDVEWAPDGEIKDTGMLIASMAYGVGEEEFIHKSWQQARVALSRAGKTHLEAQKLDISKSGRSAELVGDSYKT
jgi:hypothetical protein